MKSPVPDEVRDGLTLHKMKEKIDSARVARELEAEEFRRQSRENS